MFIVLQYCSIVFQFVVPLYFPIMLSRFSLLTCRACFDRCEGMVLRSENWKLYRFFMEGSWGMCLRGISLLKILYSFDRNPLFSRKISLFSNCMGGKFIVLTYRKKFPNRNSIGGRTFRIYCFHIGQKGRIAIFA